MSTSVLDPPPYLNTVVTKEDFGMSLAAKKTSPTLQQTAAEGEEGKLYWSDLAVKIEFRIVVISTIK